MAESAPSQWLRAAPAGRGRGLGEGETVARPHFGENKIKTPRRRLERRGCPCRPGSHPGPLGSVFPSRGDRHRLWGRLCVSEGRSGPTEGAERGWGVCGCCPERRTAGGVPLSSPGLQEEEVPVSKAQPGGDGAASPVRPAGCALVGRSACASVDEVAEAEAADLHFPVWASALSVSDNQAAAAFRPGRRGPLSLGSYWKAPPASSLSPREPGIPPPLRPQRRELY